MYIAEKFPVYSTKTYENNKQTVKWTVLKKTPKTDKKCESIKNYMKMVT